MPGANFIERLRRGAPGVRVILVPKPNFVADKGLTVSRRGRAAAVTEARSVAQRFETSIDPTRRALESIGLTDVKQTHQAGARPAMQRSRGEFETLSLVRAVTVRLRDEKELDKVLDASEKNFTPVLDVRTESDPAWRTEKAFRRRPPKHRWPKWTELTEERIGEINSAGVLVGVLDTGVDADHLEFRKKPLEFRYVPPSAIEGIESIRNVRGFDTDGHGTHVCSIIAGRKTGIVPNANLHVAAVIESETLRASLWRTVYGLDWLFRFFSDEFYTDIPCVINLSLCFHGDLMDREEVEDWRLILGRAVEDLTGKDVLVVAAAGNRGQGFTGFPANFENVLAVGAVDVEQRIADFSGLPTPTARRDIYGIGVELMSAYERDRKGQSYYRPLNGTSMAAPYVAGIAAMLRAIRPGASARDVRDHLLETAIARPSGVRIARFANWPRAPR